MPRHSSLLASGAYAQLTVSLCLKLQHFCSFSFLTPSSVLFPGSAEPTLLSLLKDAEAFQLCLTSDIHLRIQLRAVSPASLLLSLSSFFLYVWRGKRLSMVLECVQVYTSLHSFMDASVQLVPCLIPLKGLLLNLELDWWQASHSFLSQTPTVLGLERPMHSHTQPFT